MNFLKLLKVRSYFKNFIILIPVFFSKEIFDTNLINGLFLIFFVLCISASIIYIFNDIIDLDDNSFFDEVYFKKDLLELGYSICDTNYYYPGVCEKEIVNKLLYKLQKNQKKQFVLYLTVENHIPVHVKNYKESICKNYPLNLHPQFCTLFYNQLNFNNEINKFINNLNSDDLLVLFSDTPPLLSKKDRVHFEDYIDVLFFKKEF